MSRLSSAARLGALAFACPGAAMAASAAPCPPPGFVDTPPPRIDPHELVGHVEEITIDRPLDVVLAEGARTALARTLRGTSSLPGVAGTHVLRGTWAEPGAQRVTCLTDGGSVEELALINVRDSRTHRFRYEVWNYTTPKARPVDYAIGEFQETDLGDGRTHIRWTYEFRLRPNRFPGYLGPLGRRLFKSFFLDTQYAEFMRGALAVRKADAEQTAAPPRRGPPPKS